MLLGKPRHRVLWLLKVAAAGIGPYQAVANSDTPEARAQNRRIEIKLTIW